MRTIEISIYKFCELSRVVKDTVIQQYRVKFDVDEHLILIAEEWEEKLKEMGFEKPDIQYSGFGSQGDGASFTSVNIAKAKEIKAMFPSSDIEIKIVRIDRRYYHENTIRVEAYSEAISDGELNRIEKEANRIVTDICREIYRDLESMYYEVTSDEHIASFIEGQDLEFFEDGRVYTGMYE